MLESALKISTYTRGLDFDAFLEDDKTIDAVVRNFEIKGGLRPVQDTAPYF